MRSTPTFLVLLAILVIVGSMPVASAQTTPPSGGISPGSAASPGAGTSPAETSGGGMAGGAAVVIALVGLLVIVGAGVKLYDLRRKRESEAVHLQAQVSDALLREASLFGMPITPTAHVPTWKGTPAVIEISGQVPSPEMKEAALRLVQSEAARIRPDFRIEDRIAVVPTMQRRAA